MIVWSSSPWSSRILRVPAAVTPLTTVSRAVAEVVFEITAQEAQLSRAIIEVLHPVGFTVPSTPVELKRAALEIIGLAKEFAGRHVVTTRALVEVIAGFAEAHRGFQVPDLTLDAVSVAFSTDLDLSGPGQISLTDVDGRGYTLSWTSASPATLTEAWRGLSGTITTTITAPTGRLIRSFVLPIGTGQVVLTDFATVRPPERPAAGSVQEILLWNRGLSGAERSYVEGYLRCKWIPSDCTSAPLTPGQQATIEEGLIDSDPNGGGPTNPAWDDLLDDLRGDPSWLAFVDCAEAEMVTDDVLPFKVPDPDACSPTCFRAGSLSWPAVPERRGTSAIAAFNAWFDDWLVHTGSTTPRDDWCTWCNGFGACGWYLDVPGNPCGLELNPSGYNAAATPDPDPYNYLGMEDFLARAAAQEIPCLMFSDAAQTIIDSPGYLGDIPAGMEPSDP